jgi:hypothetical protein
MRPAARRINTPSFAQKGKANHNKKLHAGLGRGGLGHKWPTWRESFICFLAVSPHHLGNLLGIRMITHHKKWGCFFFPPLPLARGAVKYGWRSKEHTHIHHPTKILKKGKSREILVFFPPFVSFWWWCGGRSVEVKRDLNRLQNYWWSFVSWPALTTDRDWTHSLYHD